MSTNFSFDLRNKKNLLIQIFVNQYFVVAVKMVAARAAMCPIFTEHANNLWLYKLMVKKNSNRFYTTVSNGLIDCLFVRTFIYTEYAL